MHALRQSKARATKPRQKRCANCKAHYLPGPNAQPFEKWCSIDCAVALSRAAQDKARERKRLREAREHRERKIALKPRTKWLQEAQVAFNSYIRARDAGKPCISCGTAEQERWRASHFDAGHYRSTGSAPHMRFNVFNCYSQCVRCNRDLSGNAVEYRKNLARRISVQRLFRVEHDQELRSFDIVYLRRIKSVFAKRARHITRLRGIT